MEKKTSLLSLRLTPEESERAERVSRKDHRSQQGQFLWLMECYDKGELVFIGRLQELLGRRDAFDKKSSNRDFMVADRPAKQPPGKERFEGGRWRDPKTDEGKEGKQGR